MRSESLKRMEMFDISYTTMNDVIYTTRKNARKEEFSIGGLNIIIKRSPTPYYMNVYIPTGLLTICSFIGFLFPIGSEEGRRTAWLVTTFLMLVTISGTERNNGPAVRKIL